MSGTATPQRACTARAVRCVPTLTQPEGSRAAPIPSPVARAAGLAALVARWVVLRGMQGLFHSTAWSHRAAWQCHMKDFVRSFDVSAYGGPAANNLSGPPLPPGPAHHQLTHAGAHVRARAHHPAGGAARPRSRRSSNGACVRRFGPLARVSSVREQGSSDYCRFGSSPPAVAVQSESDSAQPPCASMHAEVRGCSRGQGRLASVPRPPQERGTDPED